MPFSLRGWAEVIDAFFVVSSVKILSTSGEEYVVGTLTDGTIGREIRELLDAVYKDECYDDALVTANVGEEGNGSDGLKQDDLGGLCFQKIPMILATAVDSGGNTCWSNLVLPSKIRSMIY